MKKPAKKNDDIIIGFSGRPQISLQKREVLFNIFVGDGTATLAAIIAKVNKNTASIFYTSMRKDIMDYYKYPPRLSGEVEMDQAFFGRDRRTKYNAKTGKLIRKGHKNRTVVFGIIQRKGIVYTKIIKRADRRVLMPIILMVVKKRSKIYTDMWKGFSKLSESGYKHFTINHSERFSDKKGVHTNTIESFWSYSKGRLDKFKGILASALPLHIKECEFRFNNRKDLKAALTKIVNQSRPNLLK